MVVSYGGVSDKTPGRCSACEETEVQRIVLMAAESKIPSATSRRVRELSRKQERTVMADLGGRVMPASGSRPGYKGDGRVFDRIRVEMKESFSSTFKITREVLNKIRGECAGKEEPVVVVDFKDKRTGNTEDRWCIIEYKILKRLMDTGEL